MGRQSKAMQVQRNIAAVIRTVTLRAEGYHVLNRSFSTLAVKDDMVPVIPAKLPQAEKTGVLVPLLAFPLRSNMVAASIPRHLCLHGPEAGAR